MVNIPVTIVTESLQEMLTLYELLYRSHKQSVNLNSNKFHSEGSYPKKDRKLNEHSWYNEYYYISIYITEYQWRPLYIIADWIPLDITKYHWISLNITKYHYISLNIIEYHWLSMSLDLFSPSITDNQYKTYIFIFIADIIAYIVCVNLWSLQQKALVEKHIHWSLHLLCTWSLYLVYSWLTGEITIYPLIHLLPLKHG